MNPPGDQAPNFRAQHPQRGQPQQYKFTSEEIRVIKECNRESFFQRCVPFGTILGFATYYGVNAGYLKRNARFGAVPKVTVSVVVGYFIGKFSYQQKCAEKLMQLPNSQLGDMLRRRRQGTLQESTDSGFGPGISLAPFSNISSSDTYSDFGPARSTDIDTTRPQMDGLDDSHRPSMDNPIYEDEMPPVQKHVTTYDELRKRNREEYLDKRLGKGGGGELKFSPAPPAISSADEESSRIAHRNKYGDVME